MREWKKEGRVTIVCGDLNVCLKREPDNAFSQAMEELAMTQICKEATHVLGGQIDHLYVSTEAVERTTLERTSPFFSDHDALCCTVGQTVVQVTTSHFDKNYTYQIRKKMANLMMLARRGSTWRRASARLSKLHSR